MKRILALTAGLSIALSGLALAQAAVPTAGVKAHSDAKPTLTAAQARAIALKARPGTVADEELETERGGSGLRYSFEIKSGGKTYEVGVDARTSQVLENQVEGSNPD